MLATPMPFIRLMVFAALPALVFHPLFADDVLFIGNSFMLGASAPLVKLNGGVPRLFKEIARAEGRKVVTFSLMVGGASWSDHLAHPATARALAAKTWTWVVLQDLSTRPTHAGDVPQFLKDGETFSDRIARTSPDAGILLYETWARPPGGFYNGKPGHDFSGPAQMMGELHHSYGLLRDDLAARNTDREVRMAPVGTAFAKVAAQYPAINLNAADHHHATAEGYYLAALVIYETIYHGSVEGAPTQFDHGTLTIPADDAAKLQQVADEVVRGEAK